MTFNFKQVNIPQSPGCYLMKNSNGEIIYIGKAKYLPARVKSYFAKTDLDYKTQAMVKRVAKIDFFVTGSEMEALILEARLIKQHQPKYNLMLKENQPYMYIKITDEEWPRLVSARRIEGKGKYFGPFTSGKARRALILTVARLFGLRTEKFISRSSKELYRLLSAIREKDLEQLDKKQYNHSLRLAEMFLRGKQAQLLKALTARMQTASKNLNYELAKFYRDQIEAIKRLSGRQLMSLPKSYDQDVVNFVILGNKLYVQVFHIKRGLIGERDQYELTVQNNKQPENELLSDFLQQYYLTRSLPQEIIVPQLPYEDSLIKKYLSDLRGSQVRLLIPKQGDKKKLLELVMKNILLKLTDHPLAELQSILNLSTLPKEIDGFDISNTSGQLSVAACVHFTDGQPNKDLYRKFKMKTEGPNDFAMIKEAVRRRYVHKNWTKPDLILIDGGKGQLSAAKAALDSLNIDIPLVSIAKKAEELFLPNKSTSIRLPKTSKALQTLQHVRDEAHRFGKSYHILLRSKGVPKKL